MAKSIRREDDRQIMLQMIEEAYRLPNWNCTSLRAALTRVSPQMAGWRPPHARRSIADITVHCAYWKYAVTRRLTGGQRGGFPYKGSNWFRTADPVTRAVWTEYRQLLNDQHEQLCQAIANCRRRIRHPGNRPAPREKWTLAQRTWWQAIHDGYHTGQVNLIKAMYRRRSRG